MRKLVIIGAGQGYDTITLRGLEHLKTADVVLYDRLIDMRLLDETLAEKVNVGKSPYAHCVKQEDINAMIARYLNEDKCVIRLKGGDSTLFSRAAEEVAIARELGALVEIVPGVTSASSAVAKVEANLTDRELASGVVFLTGHKKEEDLEASYNWQALVDLGFTLAIYMGVRSVPFVAGKLIGHGMRPDMPALIGEKIDMQGERFFVTTLAELEATFAEYSVGYPAITVIGEVIGRSAFLAESGCLSDLQEHQ